MNILLNFLIFVAVCITCALILFLVCLKMAVGILFGKKNKCRNNCGECIHLRTEVDKESHTKLWCDKGYW